MKEIYNFMQEDLNNNDVMVLDTFNTVYLWIGRNSNKHERTSTWNKIKDYLDNVTDGRDASKV